MATDAKLLDVTRTQLIQAPPARVMQAFFTEADLKGWWQVSRAFAIPRPLGMYAIHIVVRNGHTTLFGVVDNAGDRQIAEMRAREVTGVFSIENEIEVLKKAVNTGE